MKQMMDQKNRDLFNFILEGNDAKAIDLIQTELPLNTQDDQGLTALMIACLRDRNKVVTALLKANADLYLKDNRGRTALHFATDNGNMQIVDALLQKGADPNACDEGIYSPFFCAVSKPDLSLVKFFLNKGTNPNIAAPNQLYPLHMAVQKHDVTLVDLLLRYGADPNVKNQQGITPLMIASVFDDVSMGSILINHNADVNMQNIDGKTALMFAIKWHSFKMVDFLLKQNSDLFLKDLEGNILWNYIQKYCVKELYDLWPLLQPDKISYQDISDEQKNKDIFLLYKRFEKLPKILELNCIDSYEKLKNIYSQMKRCIPQNEDILKKIRHSFIRKQILFKHKNEKIIQKKRYMNKIDFSVDARRIIIKWYQFFKIRDRQ